MEPLRSFICQPSSRPSGGYRHHHLAHQEDLCATKKNTPYALYAFAQPQHENFGHVGVAACSTRTTMAGPPIYGGSTANSSGVIVPISADPDVLDVGRTISGIPPQQRSDQIIGPRNWTEALDRSRGEG